MESASQLATDSATRCHERPTATDAVSLAWAVAWAVLRVEQPCSMAKKANAVSAPQNIANALAKHRSIGS